MTTPLLQYVEAIQTKEGQQVFFIGKKAKWTVKEKSKDWIVLKRGNQTKRVNGTYRLLQEPFANFN
ncbi:hypothetical protein [Ekhidna sp.]